MHTDMTGQRVKVMCDGDIIILREFLKKCITDCIVVSLLGLASSPVRSKRQEALVYRDRDLATYASYTAQTRCKVFANARFPI